jgi:glycosyltransferase involved in cell wall biosynthesis
VDVTDVRELARPLYLVTTDSASVTRPRLLFLCQCLPFPGDEGVKIRTFNILKRLSRDFEVRALCFYRRAAHPTPDRVEAALEGLRPYAEVFAYAIPQEYSRARAAWDHARSVLTQRVYTRYAYESSVFRRDVERALTEFRPKLVHVDSLDLSGYLPMIPADIPVVCVHHNVESALLRQRASAVSGVKAQYFGLQATLTEKEEREFMPRVALNVAVSDPDRALFERIAPTARCITIPNGVDTSEIRPLADASDGIVFVGGATWFPNRDALDHFAGDILPRIRAKLGRDVPVTWVGQASEADREHFARTHGIRLTGYVDRIEPFIEQAACYVVPLRIGGGTRLKILYAWAMQRAIVSTTIGYEGLEGTDGTNIQVRDEPDAFADAVVEVITDHNRRQALAAQGRSLAESRYDWDVITRTMSRDYSALLRKRSA